jgi:hypothetical protein
VTRTRDDRGSGLVEFTWLAVLLMVPLLYLVLTVFEVQRAAFAASGGARAAARAFSLAPDPAAAHARATVAVRLALRDHGLDPRGAATSVVCSPGPCLTAGSAASVRVRYSVPLPLLPDFLGGQRPSVRVEAEHRVPYGEYREDRS